MLTVREALAYPCLASARVVAGAAGLDQVIRRVHVVDIPDANYAWGQGGLLLTAGYGLKDSPERQAALVPTLVRHGLVGLVFSIGWYFTETPPVICAAAQAAGFPVIEVPPEVEFISITEQLYTAIVNHQFALKERAADIHRQLMQLVLQGGDLAAVTTTLANILQRSVLIESPTSDILAAAQSGPVDEGRLLVLEVGRTPPDRAQRLLKRGIYAELQQKRQPVRLSAMPDLGWTMERVVAPIIVGGEIYGYIWIVEGDHPLADLDELAIEQAATVTALVMLQERAVREAQQAIRGDFLSQLLHEGPAGEPDSALGEQARAVGYRLDQPHQALFVVGHPPEGDRTQSGSNTWSPSGGRPPAGATAAQLAARLEQRLHAANAQSLVVLRERGVAVVVESRADGAGQALAEQLLADLNHPSQPVTIGVGGVETQAADGAGRSLRRSYEEAQEAAEIGQRLSPAARVTCFWELGLLDWIYPLPPQALVANPFLAIVETLAEHDQRTKGDLVRTLEAYLDSGGALAEAAGLLTVHRNTLLYRISRIEEIAAVDLRNVEQRLNLHVALKAYRLRR
jgi:purine catabolism regulator